MGHGYGFRMLVLRLPGFYRLGGLKGRLFLLRCVMGTEAPEIRLTGTPEPGEGVREPSLVELMRALNEDPELRAAVDLVEMEYRRQFKGFGELPLKRHIRKQLVHDARCHRQARINKVTIDMALAKGKGWRT